MLIRSEEFNDSIDLAHTGDFVLGTLKVRPSSREVDNGNSGETLEPRVMQVLVALARAQGAVVSRDDLTRRCWDGRIVGEDAINRCIAKLRRLGETAGGETFAIETIPRVGYRLIVGMQPTATAPTVGTPVAANSNVDPAPVQSRIRRGPLILGGSALLACISGLALAILWLFPAHWVVESSRPVVATPLIERHPAISPDGSMLVYSAGKDVFTRQLYLQRVSGGDSIRLTDDDYDHVAPNWSRDGGRIVYVAVKPGEPCHILVMPVPAGLAREVSRCLGAERSRADWDASGQAIYYSDAPAQGALSRIYRLDIATGMRSEVTHPPADSYGDVEPALSPDGKRIGFLRYRNEADAAVEALDLSTGVETTLYRGSEQPFQSWGWAEDSRDILIAGEGSGVLRRHSSFGADVDLFSSPFKLGRLARGPNGLLALEMNVFRTNLVVAPDKPGEDPAFIDPANNQTWALSFAPDGTLAMASDRSGDSAIWLMPPGRPASELAGFGQAHLLSVAFSPDGHRLAAVVASNGKTGMRILSPGGTQIATIPLEATDVGDPQWSRDGEALIFPVRDDHGMRIVRLDLKSPGNVIPLTDYGWTAVRLNGNDMLGVRSDQPGVWKIEKTPKLITAKLPAVRNRQWRVLGDDVVYVDTSNREHPHLRAQPIAGGADRPFAETPKYGDDAGSGENGEFAINPVTGKVVYTSAVQVDTDIYLLHMIKRRF